MKTQLFTLLFAAGTLTGFAQEWKKGRAVGSFTGLSVNSGIDVYLTQGTAEKLTLDVKGFEENEVKVELKNGVLKLSTDKPGGWMGWNLGRSRYVKAYVTFRQLRDLQVNGGSDLVGQGTLVFDDLNLQVNGGADLELTLKADELNVQTTGGADADLRGSVRILNAEGNGGSDLMAEGLRAEICNAISNGGSDVSVYATKEISLKATGGSDLYHAGPARVMGRSKSGGADITAR
jgi:hypothetical protein